MHPIIVSFATCLAAATGLPPAGGTISLDEFKKLIQDKVSAYKSIQYHTLVQIKIATERLNLKGTTEQTFQTMRKGDKVLFRAETIINHVRKEGNEDIFVEGRTLEVGDGEVSYTYVTNLDEKHAYRRSADPKTDYNSFNPRGEFARMERNSVLRMLPDELVDGRLAYALEVTLKPNTPEAQASEVPRTVYYYERATGIIIKAIAYDRKGRVASQTATDSIKIDGDIPADRFTFKAPDGVKIEDMPAGRAPSQP